MPAVRLRMSFLWAVLERARPATDRWALLVNPEAFNCGTSLHLQDADGVLHQVNEATIDRGLWRSEGGQRAPRPTGITKDIFDQIQRANGDQNADELAPEAADALIQVGLFGRVRFS